NHRRSRIFAACRRASLEARHLQRCSRCEINKSGPSKTQRFAERDSKVTIRVIYNWKPALYERMQQTRRDYQSQPPARMRTVRRRKTRKRSPAPTTAEKKW